MNETSCGTDGHNIRPNNDPVVDAKVASSSSIASSLEASPTSEATSWEGGFQPLDPRLITAERISNWIFIALVGLGGLIAQVVYATLGEPPGTILIAIAVGYGLLLVFLIWAGHFYPVQAYRHASWRLSEQGLDIRRGVWWRHEITIPRARVQHTDVHQGPLMRKFGLARLVVNTAGTHNASIALDGLSFETAQELRKELVADCETRSGAEEA